MGEEIVRDVVIVVPGIMGSELSGPDGPIWSVSGRAIGRAIRTLGRSIQQLQLPDGIGADAPDDGIEPTGLINTLHVVPGIWSPIVGYDGLVDALMASRMHFVREDPREPDLIPNLIEFPYDWRLSNRYNGARLASVADRALTRWREQPGMEDARLVLVCHSMGGLVARWFAEREGGADDIRAIITLGTPHRGSVKAFGTLVNGLDPGIGRFRLELSHFAQSLPSIHELLPTYACLRTDAGRIDLAQAGAPGLDSDMAAAAAEFHDLLEVDHPRPYSLHKVVGFRQPTAVTATIADGVATLYAEIDGTPGDGDGTVPRLAAEPVSGRGTDTVEIHEKHGSLQSVDRVVQMIEGILTRENVVWQSVDAAPFGVELPEVIRPGTDIEVSVVDMGDRRMFAEVLDLDGRPVEPRVRVRPDGDDGGRCSIPGLSENSYLVRVGPGDDRDGPAVTTPIAVFDPDAEDD